LIFFAMSSSLVSTMPPRGPRSVLCVVVVTTWACGNGIGMRRRRRRAGEMRHVDHEIGADLSAILRKRAKSMKRG
jgi:hypothetical protein